MVGKKASPKKTASAPKEGVLYICGTPIGNLGDITLRALECLREADIIACEDTRQSMKLLNYYEISPGKIVSYHRHSTAQKLEELMGYLKEGSWLALITDAGMPGISDPGSEVVDRALEEHFPVRVVPGPSSITSALSVSGYSGNRFTFWGYLARSGKVRRKELQSILQVQEAVVIFETPHRLEKTLADMEEYLHDRPLALIKELTKHYEQVMRGYPREMLNSLGKNKPRGEYVIVISPRGLYHKNTDSYSPSDEVSLKEDLRKLMTAGIPPAQAAKSVSLLRGVNRKKVYSLSLELKE